MTEAKEHTESCLIVLKDRQYHQGEGGAVVVRKGRPSTADEVNDLQLQLKHHETLIRLKDSENLSLTRTVVDLGMKLKSSESEISSLEKKLEINEREIEEKTEKYRTELEANEKEVEDMMLRQTEALTQVTEEVNDAIEQLENELQEVKEKEELNKQRISELEEVNSKIEQQLQDSNREYQQTCEELSEVKKKLKNSKNVNCNLRKEAEYLNKYCDRLEGLNESLRKGLELENDVKRSIKQMKCFLKREQAHRNTVLNVIAKFGDNLKKEIKLLAQPSQPKLVKEAGSQTEEGERVERGSVQAIRRALEDDLKHALMYVDSLTKQNLALKDVIRSMKKERESLEKEKEAVEEARLAGLEESVMSIKHNLLQDQKDEKDDKSARMLNTLLRMKKEK